MHLDKYIPSPYNIFLGTSALISFMSKNEIAAALFNVFRNSAAAQRLHDHWISDDEWFRAMELSNVNRGGITIDKGTFNRLFGRTEAYKDAVNKFDGSNETGVFCVLFSKRWFYYVTKKGGQIRYPSPLNVQWKVAVLAAEKTLIRSMRHGGGEATIHGAQQATTRNSQNENSESETAGNSTGADGTGTQSTRAATVGEAASGSPAKKQKIAAVDLPKTFLQSADAGALFHRKEIDADCRSTLVRRINILSCANETVDGWRSVIEGGDPDDLCTPNEIFVTRQRSLLLCHAYRSALSLMDLGKSTWHGCCEKAGIVLNPIGVKVAKGYRTVADYNIIFRRMETFPHPNPDVMSRKKPMPRLFRQYPELKKRFKMYCLSTLADLTIEKAHHHVHHKLVPIMYKIWVADVQDDDEPDDSPGLSKDVFFQEPSLEEFIYIYNLALYAVFGV